MRQDGSAFTHLYLYLITIVSGFAVPIFMLHQLFSIGDIYYAKPDLSIVIPVFKNIGACLLFLLWTGSTFALLTSLPKVDFVTPTVLCFKIMTLLIILCVFFFTQNIGRNSDTFVFICLFGLWSRVTFFKSA